MERKIVSGTTMTLLVVGIFILAFNPQQARASGTIYIRADGNIDPPTAPIQRIGDLYTFTGNIYDAIRVDRSNIVIDGNGYTLQGPGAELSNGIDLSGRTNVSVRNIQINNFYYGIWVNSSSSNSISGNNITNNWHGIQLWGSSDNDILDNMLRANNLGINLGFSSSNKIVGNNMKASSGGIHLYESSGNIVSSNIMENGNWGIWLYRSSNNNIPGNTITNHKVGIELQNSSYNNISENAMETSSTGFMLTESTNNMIFGNSIIGINVNEIAPHGLCLYNSSNNVVYGNIIANNSYGVVCVSGDNVIYHNDLINNMNQVVVELGYANNWDDNVEGNYWSNYTGVDSNHDGIGDGWHEISENNIDRYPLMGMFHSFITTLGLPVNVISNSTIESFQHFESNSTIIVHVSNMTVNQTRGFCRISIPYEVMCEPFNVTIDGANPTYWNYTLYDNGTHRWVYFQYEHTTREIVIIPEFPSFLILPLFMIATLLAIIFYRRKRARGNFGINYSLGAVTQLPDKCLNFAISLFFQDSLFSN